MSDIELIKKLQMDPLAFDFPLQKTSPYQDPAARYPLVTEVSVPVSMSAFHQSSLTIDPVDQLLGLRQGGRSIEDYVQQFCELVYQVPLYDEALFKDLFRFGLNEPVKSRLPGGEVNVRLRDFMDYALMLCDSPFTVGVAEEECDAALTHEMTAAPEHAHKMAVTTESGHKMAVTTTPRHVIAASHESSQVTADRHESSQVTADRHESSQVTADRHESLHVAADQPVSCHILSATPRYSRSVLQYPSLASSVRDAPLVSARAAGIPKPTHFSPPVPELIPLPVVLPTMGIALWCIWAAYTTTETLETAATEMSPEVAADAAEPPGVVVHAAVFPEATPAAVSPEVAAEAAEPPEAAVLSLIPCMVVAPSTALAPCPVTAKKAVCELSPCPVTVKEAVCELSPCPVTAKKAVCELLSCSVTAMDTVNGPLPCPVTVKEAVCELSPCPVTAKKVVCELSSCSVTAMDTINGPLPCPVPISEAVDLPLDEPNEVVEELSHCPVTASMTTFEPLPVSQSAHKGPFCSHSPGIYQVETINTTHVESSNLITVSMKTLSGLSVSALSLSLSFPEFPDLSPPPWRASASPTPPWWASASSVPPWWASASSAPPWRAPAPSAPPWWVPAPSAPLWWGPAPSAPPWWAPAPAAPPWWAPGHASIPGGLQPGPGPPSLPLFRLHSTTLLDCYASVWKPLLGEGLCHDPVQDHSPINHQMSPFHHLDTSTTQTVASHGLHFPSVTALHDHLISQSAASHQQSHLHLIYRLAYKLLTPSVQGEVLFSPV